MIEVNSDVDNVDTSPVCVCGKPANPIYVGSLGVNRCEDCHKKLLDEVRTAENLSNLGIFE